MDSPGWGYSQHFPCEADQPACFRRPKSVSSKGFEVATAFAFTGWISEVPDHVQGWYDPGGLWSRHVSSGFNNETEYQSRIRFSKIPYDPLTNEGAVITVYTITGEKVYSWDAAERIDSEPGDDGYSTWWDLRTINNQEIAPGLYLFTVEYQGQSFVGKFAVVR